MGVGAERRTQGGEMLPTLPLEEFLGCMFFFCFVFL